LGKKSYLTLLQVPLGRVNFEDGYGLQNSARVGKRTYGYQPKMKQSTQKHFISKFKLFVK
jgi:hypothetical protein